MSQIPILVPASKLTKSPTNVRKTSDAAADAQLEANIAEKGLIQNLIGVPVARKRGHYRITAGGRRLDAVHRLIDKKVFEPDYMLPVLILPDAKDAIEISLAENFFRLAMNPAEACRAFEDIIASEGKSPADVAKRFGVTERFVLGRLRLAGLVEPVFDALANGEITLDVAMAYASTSDGERQAAVFSQLSGGYARGNSGEIRRQLAAYSYRATDPKALLVGREAYIDAGGRIDQDLFSDAESERWLDTHIVDRLAEERLAAAAEAIRAREGYGEVRIVPAAHVPYADTYSLEPIRGELPPLTAEAEARRTEIEEELSAIEAGAGDDDMDEETDARIEALECELEAIAQRTPIISDEQRSSAVAYVVIGQDGAPRIHEQLYVAPAEPGEDDDEHDGDEDDTDIIATGDGKPAISQRLADELAMMKTELLAVHVASDPGFALDLGTFFMVEAATRTMGGYGLPSDLRATAPTPRVHGFASGTAAAAEWAKLDAALDRSWTEPDTIEGRYDAFCALSDEARAAWLGWAVARTLHAVPAGKIGSGLLDHLGRKLAIHVAAWWRPTARTYFDRITKPRILSLFADVGGPELRQRYAASKKYDLAASAERLFGGDIMVEADAKERAIGWLPDEMRFDASEGIQESQPVEHDEARPSNLAEDVSSQEAPDDLSEAA